MASNVSINVSITCKIINMLVHCTVADISFRLGTFHTILVFISVIFKRFGDAGLIRSLQMGQWQLSALGTITIELWGLLNWIWCSKRSLRWEQTLMLRMCICLSHQIQWKGILINSRISDRRTKDLCSDFGQVSYRWWSSSCASSMHAELGTENFIWPGCIKC